MATLIGTRVSDVIATANHIPEGRGFRLGNRAETHDGKKYVYVQCNTAVAAGDVVRIPHDTFVAAGLTTATAGAAEELAIAPVAFASGDYGWVQTHGAVAKINVAGSCVKNINLWTTSTAGRVDDATASNYLIRGIELLSTNPSATATTLPGFIAYPTINKRAGTA